MGIPAADQGKVRRAALKNRTLSAVEKVRVPSHRKSSTKAEAQPAPKAVDPKPAEIDPKVDFSPTLSTSELQPQPKLPAALRELKASHLVSSPAVPSHDEVALRAYLIWIDEGRPEGRSGIHWAQAEQDLLRKAA